MEALFATLESKETNKGRGKNQAGTSPRQARQTERATWNTCRQQRVPTSEEKLARTPGLGNREKREKEKETAAGPEDLNWAQVELNAKTNGVSAN